MENIEHLPASVRELIAIIGLNEALDIVRKFGGTTLLIPKGKNSLGKASLHILSEEIEDEALTKLSLYYGGEPIYIPRCDKALIKARNSEINARFVDAVKKGGAAIRTVSVLAHEYKLSDRWIWKILKNHCEPDSPEIIVNVKPETLPILKPIKELIIEDYINLIKSEVLPSVAIASLSDKYYLDRRSVKLLVGV